MIRYALLVSPHARAAYFAEAHQVAVAELGCVPDVEPEGLFEVGPMAFLKVSAKPERLRDLLRLSVVQGAFTMGGDALTPIDAGPGFLLHEDFVRGEKYRGKTSETLTQLLINVVLHHASPAEPERLRLLDPMCGRGTSLFWAMRYGITATGVEQDPTVLEHVRRGLKKWTKLHRQRHELLDGSTLKKNKHGAGRYLELRAEGVSARVIIGDTVDTRNLVQQQKFDLLVSDLPYGVQHTVGRSKRSPIDVVRRAAPAWVESLRPGGAMALAYNSYLPKRSALEGVFTDLGLETVPLDLSHRMSESIVRDVLVMTRPTS